MVWPFSPGWTLALVFVALLLWGGATGTGLRKDIDSFRRLF